MVLLCDALGDGEAQTEAAVPAPGWICPIEALENILLLRRRERRAGIAYSQPAAVVPPSLA